MTLESTPTPSGDPVRLVSTGSLPSSTEVVAALADAHERLRNVSTGALSQTYPALANSDPAHFGLALVGANGTCHEAGDFEILFTLMSVAKPFVFAVACDLLGAKNVREFVGANATGRPFNSAAAIELGERGRTNPMVNSGALATTSMIPGETIDMRWELISSALSSFAGRDLLIDDDVLASVRSTNVRNRSLALLLSESDAIEGDPFDAVELYSRQSCISVTARDVAIMGATLADGGVNPLTKQRVVSAESARSALAAMTVAGLYETSGTWLMNIGLPGKSGIAGGIVTVSPGKGALGVYSPPLDRAGNSVRGQMAAEIISRRLGLDIFASVPLG